MSAEERNNYIFDENSEMRDWAVALEKPWRKILLEDLEESELEYLSKKCKKFRNEELYCFIAYYYMQNAEELFENFKKLRKKTIW